MAYKFSYGVQVRRRTLLIRRRRLHWSKRPGYGLGDGRNRVSAIHPEGGLTLRGAVQPFRQLPSTVLNHQIGLLMRRPLSRRRDDRYPLMALLLLHHWRFLAQRHQ
jgi:hypothetical protein